MPSPWIEMFCDHRCLCGFGPLVVVHGAAGRRPIAYVSAELAATLLPDIGVTAGSPESGSVSLLAKRLIPA